MSDRRVILTSVAKLTLLSVFLFVMPCCLLLSCAGGNASAQTAGFTAEYRSFLSARKADSANAARDSSGGYQFTLDDGRLCVVGTDSSEVWRSKDEWYVDSFKIGDVNRDQILDIAFVVWKSYSFGAEHPARMTNEDAAVRCHLFVYSIKDNMVKPLWCSSSLPRPIYSFELDEPKLNASDERTPILSGARLLTREGAYTEDYSRTASNEYMYEWNSWGFRMLAAPGPESADRHGAELP